MAKISISLDNPRFTSLPDGTKWRYVSLCLMVAECENGGYFGDKNGFYSLDDIAWCIRVEGGGQSLLLDMERLEKVGLVSFDEGNKVYYIDDFDAIVS